ncbi:DNA recombination protein rmuC [Mycoplasmopsis maculosa]|uniref:DNA recombination protein rmuC n=1 Tax=Mycoplasmopsis maculosa TaxID=114885 RepID=A0A449B4A7_9BACT|nr:DNA recombination protein RmuC [Mycoplasmopsis maculosa]VEU75432.1 DNA recombination protein rmuC [Mycoplasmopsis maculosa]
MDLNLLIINLILIIILITFLTIVTILFIVKKPFKKVDLEKNNDNFNEEIIKNIKLFIIEEFNKIENRISNEKTELLKENNKQILENNNYYNDLKSKLQLQINDYQKNIEIKLEEAVKNFINFQKNLEKDNNNLFEKIVENNNKKVTEEFIKLNEYITKMVNEGLNNIKSGVDSYFNEKLTNQINDNFKNVGEKIQKLDSDIIKLEKLQDDVGNLNKVMSGVKTRGNFGEFHLDQILEDQLNGNYEKQFKLSGDDSLVDFAIRIYEKDKSLFLPIDSKFPLENYIKYISSENKDEQENYLKELFNDVISMAKSISKKYIIKGVTTDNALMYIPSESVYALLLSNPEKIYEINNKYNVVIVGPSTILTFINYSKITVASAHLKDNIKLIKEAVDAIVKKHSEINSKLDEADNSIAKSQKAIETVRRHTGTIYNKLTDRKFNKSLNALEQENNTIEDN